MVEEYQHWLHIKLIDSLPNSYSIFLPSGLPSASFKLFQLALSLPLSFLPSLLPLLPSLLLSHLLSLFLGPSLPSTHPYKTSHSLSLCLCLVSFFLTSSSVVWLTEKCLICSAFLLDSSWSKMSATPPGATGTWYSTIVKCWSCVLGNNAQGEG